MAWDLVGNIRGPAGQDGAPGAPGSNGAPGAAGAAGASAYALAVTNGFVGTQAQWLASLKGVDGVNAAAIDPMAAPPVTARIDIATAGNADITSKIVYLDCTVTISGVPGVPDYFGLAQIRGRGNSTWDYGKKPYKLKLKKKASLMGMPSYDDWALLANAHESDPSMINSPVGMEIGQKATGVGWTPRSQLAVLYLNGAYWGLYQLIESVKITTSRLNVTKATGTTGLALTGAYLLEIDRRGYGAGEPAFQTGHGVQIIYDDPDGSVAAQATYIQTAIQTFEDVLYNDSTWLDATNGYKKYIDLNSFVDWYLVNELLSSQDSNFYASCKLWKDRDPSTGVPGKIHMGPLWDFNLTLGTGLAGQIYDHPPTGFYTRNYTGFGTTGAIWIDRMFSDPAFTAALWTRWQALVTAIGATPGDIIDGWVARTTSESSRDKQRWSYGYAWASQSAGKKAWLTTRIQWLTEQFAIPTAVPAAPTGLVAVAGGGPGASLSWNPVRSAKVTDYVVQWRVVGDSTWNTFADGTSVNPAALVTGLSLSTAYEFQVAAVNSFGQGAFSAIATLTLPASLPAVLDRFTRADRTNNLGVAETGQTWQSLDSTFGIKDNQAYLVSGGGNAVAVVDSGLADCVVTGTLYHHDLGGQDWQRLIFRAVDAANYWCVQIQSGALRLYRVVSGGFNLMASEAIISDQAYYGVPNVLVLEATLAGNNITIKQDGVTRFTASDSGFATATKHGFGGGNHPLNRWDDFKVV